MIMLAANPSTEASMIAAVIMLAALLAIYFLPWIVAAARRHPQSVAIFILNLFFGWTLIGWVAALIWASIKREPPQVVYIKSDNN